MRKTILSATAIALLATMGALSQEAIDTVQVHFVCGTKERARQMALNLLEGQRILAPECRWIQDLQYSIVELYGPLEVVYGQGKIVHIGYVKNDFVTGYSVGQLEHLVN